jgi:hypothetical protein
MILVFTSQTDTPNDEKRATKKRVLKYLGSYANAFSAICQCEYSIQVARNHDAGILKTASEGLRDRDRAAGETHTNGIGDPIATTEPTESV